MENKTQTGLLRPFGQSEKVKADDYKVGQEITVQILEFGGAERVIDRDGMPDVLPIYRVTIEGQQRTWTMTTFCQKACMKFGIKDYADLNGKTITAKIKKYGIGNGFVIVNVK